MNVNNTYNRIDYSKYELLNIAEADEKFIYSIDNELRRKYRDKPQEVFYILFLIVSNNASSRETISKYLPQVFHVLKSQEKVIISQWIQYITGNDNEFLFAISCVNQIISKETILVALNDQKWNDDLIIDFLQGSLLFLLDENIILFFVFELVDNIIDFEKYTEFCKEVVYANYSGTTYKMAVLYKDNMEEKKKKLANLLIDYNSTVLEKIKACSLMNEFRGSTKRQIICQKMQNAKYTELYGQNFRNQVLFSDLFRNVHLKFGQKFAYVQTSENEKIYQTGEYTSHSWEKELPKELLMDPVGFTDQKIKYLEKRNNNETNY